MQTVRIGNVNLSYDERGSGHPVLMVHGIPTDNRAWSNQLQQFSLNFRAISISRRHAYPNKNDGLNVTESTVANNSNDLVSLIQYLKLSQVNLVGHSYGGFISLYTAWKHPDLFRSLVLIEPAVPSLLVKNEKSPFELLIFLLTNFSAATSARRFQNGNLKLALKSFEERDWNHAVRYFYEGIMEKDGSFDTLPPEIQSMMLDNSLTVGELETEFPIFTKEDAKSMKLPTLLVKAQNSPKWLRAIVDVLAKTLPNQSLVNIPSSCHFPHFENPSQFNAAVIDFLKKNNPS